MFSNDIFILLRTDGLTDGYRKYSEHPPSDSEAVFSETSRTVAQAAMHSHRSSEQIVQLEVLTDTSFQYKSQFICRFLHLDN